MLLDWLIYLLIGVLILSLIWWVITKLPLPDPIRPIVQVVMVVVIAIFVISMLLGLMPGHGYMLHWGRP
jgi:hypothetical protein